MTGTIKKLFLDRGFGFISPGPGKADVFFHAQGLVDPGQFANLTEGLAVSYEASPHPRGPRAINVATEPHTDVEP